jgi:hypothetical protein
MKRILALISALMVIGLLVIPSGVAFADQLYHTDRLPLHSLIPSEYPLRNGMVINLHPNGPNNMSIEHFMLNGAKPNTTYELCRVFQGETSYGGIPIPPEWPTDTGYSIQTDSQGNGNCTIHLTPEYLAPFQPRTFTGKFVLMVGGSPVYGIWVGGLAVYETDWFEAQLEPVEP